MSWHPFNAELFSSSWDFSVTKWDGVEGPGEEDDFKMDVTEGIGEKWTKRNPHMETEKV